MIHAMLYDGFGALHDVTDINALNGQLKKDASKMTIGDFKRFLKQKNVFLAIARDDEKTRGTGFPGKIIGKATLHVTELDDGTKKGTVEQVVVDEAYRGQGVGDMLDDTLCNIARENGVRYIDLTSAPARIAANKFYVRRGYARRETNVYRKMMT